MRTPLAPLAHVGQSGPGAVHEAHDVDVEDAPEVVERSLLERGECGDRGAVDPGVDAAEALDRPPREHLDGIGGGHIRWDRERGPSATLAFASNVLQRDVSPRGEHHLGAVRGTRERSRPPDAARRARDHDHRIPDPHTPALPRARRLKRGLPGGVARLLPRIWIRVLNSAGGVPGAATVSGRSAGPLRLLRARDFQPAQCAADVGGGHDADEPVTGHHEGAPFGALG
jgi:hypothetical protein